jgi:hypothetical protein
MAVSGVARPQPSSLPLDTPRCTYEDSPANLNDGNRENGMKDIIIHHGLK